MTTLDDAAQLGAKEQGLAVISTLRADGTIQSSVVNAGVMRHPLVEQPVVAFVSYGRIKLANLRARPQLTATFRSGWQWVAVEGYAQLIGPDDPHPEIGLDPVPWTPRKRGCSSWDVHVGGSPLSTKTKP
jgi:hypothetical protein